VHEYCGQTGVEILQEIPDDRRIAEAYSRGELLCREFKHLYQRLNELLCRLIERAA
jgi:MinD superfamily P-loop ATPase